MAKKTIVKQTWEGCHYCKETGKCAFNCDNGYVKEIDPHPQSWTVNKSTGSVKCPECRGSGNCTECNGRRGKMLYETVEVDDGEE